MSDLTIDPLDRRPLPGDDAAEPLEHYVSPAPFDPMSVEAMTVGQERYNQASQWRLMWWRLLRHRVAVVSGFLLLFLYATTLVSEFLAPYALDTRNTDFIYAPPQKVHLFDQGRLVAPYVEGYDYRLDMTQLKRVYTPNPDKHQTIRFFCKGDPYLIW